MYASRLLKSAKNSLRDFLAQGLSRDEIYNKTYYTYVDKMARESADTIAEVIISNYSPKSVIDIGCGTGAAMDSLRRRGVAVYGLEYSSHALAMCKARGLDVEKYDIESGKMPEISMRFDVVLCAEVAEHVKPEFADALVSLASQFADRVLFTAAVPGQGGGVDHVNEQPNSYWVQKFALLGYTYLEEASLQNRVYLQNMKSASFYAQNLMLFKKIRLDIEASLNAGRNE